MLPGGDDQPVDILADEGLNVGQLLYVCLLQPTRR